MLLTTKQEQGLRTAVERYNAHEPWTCIAGYAGTGKSTLVRFIIAALNIDPEDVAYIAYTGKAAMVLKDKGCPNAQTAHRLLYQSYPRNDGTFYHKPRRPLEKRYKLIVVDEVSMLPEEIWNLLLSHGIHVLALGDPFQLPAIGTPNTILSHPHIFLDEVLRQAQESEILRLSMQIREGKPLELFSGEEVQVLPQSKIVDGMFTWADEIIVAKNKTRRDINTFMRKFLHGVSDPMPIKGDKVICIKNAWELANGVGDAMVNGTIGTMHNIRVSHNNPFLKPYIIADFLSEDYSPEEAELSVRDLYFRNISFDGKLLTTGEPTVTQYNFKTFPKAFRPQEFDYGYCITCWKAQGSEYNNVLLFEENFPFQKEEHARYLYTGITRAKDKLVIIKDYK